MLVVLPIITFLLLCLSFNQNWRDSILRAAVVWGTMLTAIVEITSIFRTLTISSVSLCWLMINLGLIWLLSRQIRNKQWLKLPVLSLPLHLGILLGGVGAIVLITGLIAIIAPPNTWDAMTYHLPRVVHWLQNQTVSHYPTNFLPQLYYTPWSEYAILNWQILSGGDRLANLVQWLGMIGSLIGVSLIAKQLGKNSLSQIVAVVFTATLPMGILQASSSKNDYSVALWLVCLVYFILSSISSKQYLKNAPLIGLSLGLAVFTKPTAYPYSFPFMIWLIWELCRDKPPKLLGSIGAIAAMAIALNLGLFTRNFALFGTPLFSHPGYQTNIASFNLLLSNILKNIALHLPIPLINSQLWLELALNKIHQIILKVDLNDPRISAASFTLPQVFNFEDNAPNPWHFYLIIVAILILVIKPIPQKPILTKYLVALTLAFLLFCYLAKWQPWQSRLHLSLFVLFAPLVSTIFTNIFSQRINIYLALLLLGLSSFWLFYNESRPLLMSQNILNTPRQEQYFNTRSDLKDGYFAATKLIEAKECHQVGLFLTKDDWEYPFWVLLKNQYIEIRHVNVENISGSQGVGNFKPCVIVAIAPQIKPFLLTQWGTYQQIEKPISLSLSGYLQIYERGS